MSESMTLTSVGFKVQNCISTDAWKRARHPNKCGGEVSYIVMKQHNGPEKHLIHICNSKQVFYLLLYKNADQLKQGFFLLNIMLETAETKPELYMS